MFYGPANRDGKMPTSRAPIKTPFLFKDFSINRFEEHYQDSHPCKLALFQAALSQECSASTVKQFFDSQKVKRYFERSTAGGYSVTISIEVGELLKFLYEKDTSFACDDPEVSSVEALHFVGSTEDDKKGYVAELESRATFSQVVTLARVGVSGRLSESRDGSIAGDPLDCSA